MMSRWNIRIFIIMTVSAIALILGSISIRSLASVQRSLLLTASAASASPSNTATDSDADQNIEEYAPVELQTIDAVPMETKLNDYIVCQYNFSYSNTPLIWPLGEVFETSAELPDAVDVYIDGPEGHVNDELYLPVSWDLSGVDFTRVGDYSVIGSLDTSSCEYPVDWKNSPLPLVTIEISEGGVLSFYPELTDDTLTLKYRMNGEPFQFSEINMFLFESTDGGKNWKNISQSKRVRILENQLSVSGITLDSMFQALSINLPGAYASCSDIVKVETLSGIPFVGIISSEGEEGGELWGDGDWDWDSLVDGPYQILGYGILNSRVMGLEKKVTLGDMDTSFKSLYNSINVYYGEEGKWMNRLNYLLPVQWDWAPLDTIDWNQPGKTYIYGTFTEQDMLSCTPKLDFEHMPELVLPISVSIYQEPISLNTDQQVLFKDNTLIFDYRSDNNESFSFQDTEGLTLWCSTDREKNWYNITNALNVTISRNSLSISHLKDKLLKEDGYIFQLEQSLLLDYESFSEPVEVYHGVDGITFGPDIGGDRWGGNRHEKPPEGLFDVDEPETSAPESSPSEPESSAQESVPNEPESSASESGTNELESSSQESISNEPESSSQESVPNEPESSAQESVPNEPVSSSQESVPNEPASSALKSTLNKPEFSASEPVPNSSRTPGESNHRTVQDRDNSEKEKHPPVPSFAAFAGAAGTRLPGRSEIQIQSSLPENINNGKEKSTAAKPLEESASPALLPIQSDTASRNKIFRIIVSLSAVLAGGIAGFFMIRRR